jgi:hypothetical protein
MNRRTDPQKKDEKITLSRIIAGCVQAQYRYLADVDPHDFGKRVAREVMDWCNRRGLT